MCGVHLDGKRDTGRRRLQNPCATIPRVGFTHKRALFLKTVDAGREAARRDDHAFVQVLGLQPVVGTAHYGREHLHLADREPVTLENAFGAAARMLRQADESRHRTVATDVLVRETRMPLGFLNIKEVGRTVYLAKVFVRH